MKAIIITNNPKVYDEFFAEGRDCPSAFTVEYLKEASQEDILLRARALIHLGGRLIIHPMMGRIKPHETPYKSVFMEVPEEKELAGGSVSTDFMSVTIIEDSISETRKLLNNTFMKKYDDTVLEDLQQIDLLLIKSGIEEYR